MKIMFDSNVWQKVCIPSDYEDDEHFESLLKIHKAIRASEIQPFISEVIFTYEAIRKKDRLRYFSNRELSIIVKNRPIANGIGLSVKMSQSQEGVLDFSEMPDVEKYWKVAKELGFKITYLPRLGMMIHNCIIQDRTQFNEEDFWEYAEKVAGIVKKIETKGAGKAHLALRTEGLKGENIFQKLKNVPPNKVKAVAKDVAEWADGDSVAASIALDLDFFCTRDVGIGAGSKSVLSPKSLKWLREEYGFESILPLNLAKKLN
jgi:hypothetical protein